MSQKETIRDIKNRNDKKKIPMEAIMVKVDIKKEIDKLRIPGDSYDTMLRILHCF